MGRKIYFYGLRTEEFIHPKEAEAKKTLLGSKGYQKMVAALSKAADIYNFTKKEGEFTLLSRQTAPELFRILEDTCRILDIGQVPDLYMIHPIPSFCSPAEPGKTAIW